MSLWKYYAAIDNYTNLPDDEKKEILSMMSNSNYFNNWHYLRMLKPLIPQITPEKGFELYSAFVNNPKTCSPDTDNMFDVVTSLIRRYKSPQDIKDVISKSGKKTLPRVFLGLYNISETEEELGLRSISNIGMAPNFVYARQYKPSIKAVKALPPVMRLGAIEALLANIDISYNMFENFTQDEFKNLLFGSVLRHRERVEAVYNKFLEIQDIGKQGKITVEYECVNCQKFSITIDSIRIRTETGLLNTSIGRTLTHQRCPLCGRYGHDNIKSNIITYLDDDQ